MVKTHQTEATAGAGELMITLDIAPGKTTAIQLFPPRPDEEG